MAHNGINARRRIFFFAVSACLCNVFLLGRVAYLQSSAGGDYVKMAYEQQTRERWISPRRGDILDRNGITIAGTQTAYAVSVINAQIEDAEKTASVLSEVLDMDYNEVLEKVNKKVALVRIKSKVDSATITKIREMGLKGVMIDEDIKRIYPYTTMASQVIGFVGKDNQGIIGLEAKYDSILQGKKGKIMTYTKGSGKEIPNLPQQRKAPVDGGNLVTTIDVNIQQFAEQLIQNTVKIKQAKSGAIIVMNPQNGEIYAMANYPNFDLNTPYTINDEETKAIWDSLNQKEKNDALNKMWRNFTINDTYEPGSTFKVITSAAGLQEGAVKPSDTFNCGAGRTIAGRLIKCWRSPRSHGSENFVQGVQNSCNPVFMDVAARLGGDKFYEYMCKYGFKEKTGVDLPGEAVGIIHAKDKIGPLELATMSFGQGFQITPLQLISGIAATINGGNRITPHFAKEIRNSKGETTQTFEYDLGAQVISKATSDTMREILESVVAEGTGSKTYIPGMRIGGKTATSQKLPRGNGKYIASFCAFAPAEDPQAIALVLINEPQGVYYGGQVAGPVMQQLLSNVLPYLDITPQYNEKEMPEYSPILVEEYVGKKVNEARKIIEKAGGTVEVQGEGDTVKQQFPRSGEYISRGSRVILYLE